MKKVDRKLAAQVDRNAVSRKISKLAHEGKPQDQAVAMALNMKREGRLGPRGGYRRVKR
jgi:hypothetical protein